jgi:ABC-type uncharacterized transport system permease subunit
MRANLVDRVGSPKCVPTELAASSFRRHLHYRIAIVAAMFTNSVFGLVRASLLITAVGAAGGSVAGYDTVQASTYVWLGQSLVGVVPLWAITEISQRIKAGTSRSTSCGRPCRWADGWRWSTAGPRALWSFGCCRCC